MGKILVTCTRPRVDVITNDLRQNGYDAVAMPALTVSVIHTPMVDDQYDVVLVTSTHAFLSDIPKLPMICVGAETADIAKAKGYDVIQIGTGGIDDLDLSPYQNILYPCAVEPTKIPENTTPWRVYETHTDDDFTIDDDIETIIVFSTKAAKIIAGYNLNDKNVICLSQKISNVFVGCDCKKLEICTHPSYDSVKQLILKGIGAHT